jgi:hypothetical protein
VKVIFSIILLFTSLESEAKPKYQFHLQRFPMNPCQHLNASREMQDFLNWVVKVAPLLEQNTRNAVSYTSELEKLYLNNNPLAFAGVDIMRDILNTFTNYCHNYEDTTALNAILHFAMSATLAHTMGEKMAKELVDLHEALPYNFERSDGKKVIPMSQMDIYNNYVGIEYGLKFPGIPEGRLPKEFFLELGAKLYAEGKLKAISIAYFDQYCLFPKSKFQGPPMPDHLRNLNDKRIFDHYTLIEVEKKRSLQKKNELTEEDIRSVINNEDPSVDPLFHKLKKYQAAIDICCD